MDATCQKSCFMPLELWMSAESFHAHLKEQEIFEEWKGVLVSFFHSRYMQMSNWLPPGPKLREQDMAPLGLEQIPGREKIFLETPCDQPQQATQKNLEILTSPSRHNDSGSHTSISERTLTP